MLYSDFIIRIQTYNISDIVVKIVLRFLLELRLVWNTSIMGAHDATSPTTAVAGPWWRYGSEREERLLGD